VVPADLTAFETLLYGDVATAPSLPAPDAVIAAFVP
jgi:hypothetical protein